MSNQVFAASRGIIAIEFVFAFLLEILVVGRLADKLAFRIVNPAEEKPYVVTTAIILSTVVIMCPAMSFIATILYNGITIEFLANWMQKIVINFPFAVFTQLFFIQPLVRFLFGLIFKKQLEIQKNEYIPENVEFD